jgi:hypothetical protein
MVVISTTKGSSVVARNWNEVPSGMVALVPGARAMIVS